MSLRRRLDATSLRHRLLGLLVAAAVVAGAAATLSAVSVQALLNARQTLLDQVDPASLDADQLLLAFVDEETGVRGYVLSANAAFLQPYSSGLSEARGATAALTRDLAGQPALRQLADAAEAAGETWKRDVAVPAIDSVATGSRVYATTPKVEVRAKDLFDTVRARFGRLQAALGADRASATSRLDDATTVLVVVLAVSFGLVVLTGLATIRALNRWVTRPLLHIGADAQAVAAGEVEHPIELTGPPEFAGLAADVEAMRQRIVDELEIVHAARVDLAERNEELARSNVELEQFAYVASHDLQEPLRKVISFVQLLQHRYQGQLDDRADQFIEYAVDGASRMQVLVNDLLTFSRVGRTSERFTDVALDAAVAAALANLGSALAESGATVTTAPLPVVWGNPVLLTSLWQNLIGNSLKFRAEDRPTVAIDVEQGADDWTFGVTDNGIGIEPRFADKVFVIFQRLHSRDAYRGTGIGLALCKKIVELHGGRIWLDVGYHAGARIRFTLPAERGTGMHS